MSAATSTKQLKNTYQGENRMEKVKVTLWKLTPEEIVALPRGTQIIEYCTHSRRMRIKERGKTPAYDFVACIYLLAAPDKEKSA